MSARQLCRRYADECTRAARSSDSKPRAIEKKLQASTEKAAAERIPPSPITQHGPETNSLKIALFRIYRHAETGIISVRFTCKPRRCERVVHTYKMQANSSKSLEYYTRSRAPIARDYLQQTSCLAVIKFYFLRAVINAATVGKLKISNTA